MVGGGGDMEGWVWSPCLVFALGEGGGYPGRQKVKMRDNLLLARDPAGMT